MTHTNANQDYLIRENILKLLSDDETASVSTAEGAAKLTKGDEYIDLEQLGRGVQKADGSAIAMGRMLPKKAVHKDTWAKILKEIATCPSATAHLVGK